MVTFLIVHLKELILNIGYLDISIAYACLPFQRKKRASFTPTFLLKPIVWEASKITKQNSEIATYQISVKRNSPIKYTNYLSSTSISTNLYKM